MNGILLSLSPSLDVRREDAIFLQCAEEARSRDNALAVVIVEKV